MICLDYIDVGDESWRRMLETKCDGDSYSMLVTVFAISITKIHYILRQCRAQRLKIYYEHQNLVTKITMLPLLGYISVTLLGYNN